MRSILQCLLAVLIFSNATASVGSDSSAAAETAGTPDATFTISGGVVAFGVGYEWARGALLYQGRMIPFWVRGVSVMDIGAGKIAGTGEVFHLNSLADFEGDYGGTTFGSAISRGTSLSLLKNRVGVTLKARSTISGVRFNFSG